VYRHFPTRERLLEALTTSARDATAARLAEADLDTVPVTEAIARVARVIASGGSKYAAVAARFGTSDYTGDAEQQIGTMIHSLLRRGIDDGTLRTDLTSGELASLLGSLLQGAARITAEHRAGEVGEHHHGLALGSSLAGKLLGGIEGDLGQATSRWSAPSTPRSTPKAI
jgi:AcrR family transcriptional regulator